MGEIRTTVCWALLTLALGLLAGGCTTPSEDLPAEVLGRWATTEPRYADRFFEIESEILRFGTGGNSSEVYSITLVATEPHPRGRLFRVTYRVNDVDMQFDFYYDAGTSSIRLHNQSGFEWVRAGKP